MTKEIYRNETWSFKLKRSLGSNEKFFFVLLEEILLLASKKVTGIRISSLYFLSFAILELIGTYLSFYFI